MKIKDVRYEVYLQKKPFEPPKGLGGWPADVPPDSKPPFPIMRIITDDGIEGFDFGAAVNWAYPGTVSERDINRIRREIIGRDPFDREWIWQRLRFVRLSVGALSAVDVALWDIAGKALGQPIYKLMGAYRDKVKVYATSWRLPAVQDYVDEALECQRRGIAGYKLHARPEIAIEACRAVRKAVGGDMKLMLDLGGRYGREEALRVGRIVEELNFYWLEEPVVDQDIEGLVKVRGKLHVSIAATEKALMSMIPEYLLRGACDIIRCDTRISGGITPCKKIADMCDAFGMQCEIHLGGAANLHVECAIKNCEFYEMFWPEFRYGLKEYPVLDKEGYIHVPQKPGLGVEIDWESLGKPVAIY